MAFGAIVVTLLFGLGAAFGEVRMPLWQWLAMGGALVAGAIPFCALGLAIATLPAQFRSGHGEHDLSADGVLQRIVDPVPVPAEGHPGDRAAAAIVPPFADRVADSGGANPGRRRDARGSAGWLYAAVRRNRLAGARAEREKMYG